MAYLIDGSNLGGVAGGARGTRDPAELLRWLAPWSRRRGPQSERICVVFDGAEQPGVARQYGRIAVRFAAPQSADEAIVALVRVSPEGWTVVTDDRELGRRVREAGGRVSSASALWADVNARRSGEPAAVPARRRGSGGGEEKPRAGSEGEHWRRVFGVEEE